MASGENTRSCVGLFAWLWWAWVATDSPWLKKAPVVGYEDVLKEFDLVWCVKGLILTCSN